MIRHDEGLKIPVSAVRFRPWAPFLFLRQSRCYKGNGQISSSFCRKDQQEKDDEFFTHDAGHNRQRIADNRHPAEQQRPAAIAMIKALCLFQRGSTYRKPFPVLESFKKASQPPVDARAQNIARRRHEKQKPWRDIPFQQKANQYCFGLHGKDCGRRKSGKEQPEEDCKRSHSDQIDMQALKETITQGARPRIFSTRHTKAHEHHPPYADHSGARGSTWL